MKSILYNKKMKIILLLLLLISLSIPQTFAQSNVYSFTEEFSDTIVMESDAMFFIYKTMSEYVNKVAELESERESLNQKITHRDLIIMLLMLGYVVIFLRFLFILEKEGKKYTKHKVK